MAKRRKRHANQTGRKRRQTENTSARNSASAADNEIDDYNRPVQASSDEEYDEVDPWTAFSKKETGFDYEELITRLKCEKVDRELVKKIEALIGRRVHHLISRNIAVSHRDMNRIIEQFKAKRSDGFYLYTGRGPSSKAMHLGHAIPFILTKWFQDTFNVPLVIQITDDEKFLWKKDIVDIDAATRMANENIKDIIAFGFDPKKTFIFKDTEYMRPEFYKNICRIEKQCSVKDIKAWFDFNDDDCIGKLTFPAIQAAPSFRSSFPDFLNSTGDMLCLIPCAIDQDSIFMMAREIASKVEGFAKPAVLHTQFLASLKSRRVKMSSSHPEGVIFLTDSRREIERKIKTCEKEIVLQYLSFFMEDDASFEQIKEENPSRTLQNLQRELTHVLTEFLKEFRRRRNNITEERVKMFMSPTK